REPGPGDRLFPDLPHPEHLEALMVEDLKAAGLDPAFIYAFEKTGLLVTEQNQHLIPDSDLAEWDAAIEEYKRNQRRQLHSAEGGGTVSRRGPMPRKKRETGGRGPKKRRPRPPLEKLPDRRALEGAMHQLVAGLQGQAQPDTPLGQAQALLYRAFEEA